MPKYCKLPAHMHDTVSVVDRFNSFWFSSRNSFQGQNLLLCKLLLFSDQISGEGAEVSEGTPLVGTVEPLYFSDEKSITVEK